MTDPLKNLVQYERELFAHLDEFFVRATGKHATEFSTVADFGDVVRANASTIGSRGEEAFRWLDTEVRAIYERSGIDAFRDAKQLGGMRLVLGGSSRFLETQLNSVSTSVLYSDTVLIPDPVMPWLEQERREERFRHVLLLQAIHCLLQLKPLVDAELPCPPVVVFPSWEKSLEDHDAQTQQGISQLLTDLIANSLGEELVRFEEVLEFADKYPQRFCKIVDQKRLFIAPGGDVNEPLEEALLRYDKEMATWRSKDWLDSYNQRPVHRRVINGMFERVAPVYHLLENAQEFTGHPLMCLEQHAHYFRLVSQVGSARLERLGALDHKTGALVNALGSRRLQWLGGLSADILVKLRMENENELFRRRLSNSINRLHESNLGNVDQIAAEVCHEIEAAIAEHDRNRRDIQEKYKRIHGQTAVLFIATVGAALIPALAPLLGCVAPFVLVAKYGLNKITELAERRALTQSLVGVLASAKREQ